MKIFLAHIKENQISPYYCEDIKSVMENPPDAKCEKCGSPRGRRLSWHPDPVGYIKAPCKKCDAEILERHAHITMEKDCGVGSKHSMAKLSNFGEALKGVDPNKGIFLWGAPGTGKTHALAALCRHWIVIGGFNHNQQRPNIRPCMTSVPTLLQEIKATFNKDSISTEQIIVDRHKDGSVLMLDDLGAEYSTEWATGVMFLIINHRYENQMPTYFSSNLNIKGISEKLGDRIASRITEMCQIVHLKGTDRRQGAKVFAKSPEEVIKESLVTDKALMRRFRPLN